jgi:hypothetical protein
MIDKFVFGLLALALIANAVGCLFAVSVLFSN